MKALTLTQPWATLVAIGAKRIETRGWRTSYRGPIAIHAAKGFPRYAKDFCYASITLNALGWPRALNLAVDQSWLNDIDARIKALPVGAVIATANLVSCCPTSRLNINGILSLYEGLTVQMTAEERAFGDYSSGRWAWILDDVRQLPEPLPANGALGLWEWEVINAK